MAQSIQLHLFNPIEMPEKLETTAGGSVYVRPLARQFLTKADLRQHFGCCDNRALLRKVFTAEILTAIEMDVNTFKLRKEFTLTESARIYDALGINWLKTSIKAK
jgi:hypothetical protein